MDKITNGLGVEINYDGTETRIWSAQKRFKAVKRFFDDSNHFLSSVLNKDCVAGTVLAIKNNKLTNNNYRILSGVGMQIALVHKKKFSFFYLIQMKILVLWSLFQILINSF